MAAALWLLSVRHTLKDFDVTVAGMPVLKRGRNVLAVKATKSGGQIDLGLFGVKGRPAP